MHSNRRIDPNTPQAAGIPLIAPPEQGQTDALTAELQYHMMEEVPFDTNGSRYSLCMPIKRHPQGSSEGQGGRFAPGGRPDQTPTSSLSLADQEAATSPRKAAPSGHNGVSGALAPDKSEVSWWRAKEWADKNDQVLVDTVRFSDGKHGLVVAESSPDNPRRDVDDLHSGLGTIAICGKWGRHYGDSESGGGRVDWWKHGLDSEVSTDEGFMWMMAEMNGEESSPRDWEYDFDDPEITDMWNAAQTYQERTGDFAFPLYAREAWGNVSQMQLAKPGGETLEGTPMGFMILSAEQAKTLRNDTDWDAAHQDLTSALDVYNDWSEGSPTSGICAVFSSDPDEEPEIMGTGFHKSDELEEVAKGTLAEMA